MYEQTHCIIHRKLQGVLAMKIFLRRLVTLSTPFRIFWLLFMFIGEKLVFDYYVLTSWPYIESETDHHLLVISDPQLVDNNCYNSFVKPRAILSDKYMSRAYRALLRWRKPDSVLFLGDLLDGGREWEDDDFFTEIERFNYIFQTKNEWPVKYYQAGNHDIGIGNTLKKERAERFKKTFKTELNYVTKIQDTNLIVLNSLGLVEPDDNPLALETKRFMKDFISSGNPSIKLQQTQPTFYSHMYRYSVQTIHSVAH